MADNGFKINKSLNLNPQAGAPANPVDGDIYYDSTIQSFAYYHNGSWANFDSVGTVASTLWLTSAQLTPAIVRNSVIKVTGGVALSHLAGISASFSGRKISIYNAGSATIVVEPQDANESTANNRIQTPTGGSMNLVAGEIAVFTYDIVASRWLLVSISSNAGSQVIATTSNPGLVTLHKASLLPLDGVVLSDGDLNTAGGVVGLDVNKAVNIAAPLINTTALTVHSFGDANKALDLYGHMEFKNYSTLTIYGGVQLSGSIATGIYGPTFTTLFPNSSDGGGITGVSSFDTGLNTLKITLTEYFNSNQLVFSVDSTRVAISTQSTVSMDIGPNEDWRFDIDGTLHKMSTAARIRNVADPAAAQDVTTKNYVDNRHTMGYILGASGATAAITTTPQRLQSSLTSNATYGNVVLGSPGGTSWYITTPSGVFYRVQGRLSFKVSAVTGATYILLTFKPSTGSPDPATLYINATGGAFSVGQTYSVPFSYYINSAGDEAYFLVSCDGTSVNLTDVVWDFYLTKLY